MSTLSGSMIFILLNYNRPELTVHILKCIVRGHVCCPLIHDSLSYPMTAFK